MDTQPNSNDICNNSHQCGCNLTGLNQAYVFFSLILFTIIEFEFDLGFYDGIQA